MGEGNRTDLVLFWNYSLGGHSNGYNKEDAQGSNETHWSDSQGQAKR